MTAGGDSVTYKGQVYRCVGFQEVKIWKKDKKGRVGTEPSVPCTVSVWATRCADCGAPFQVTLGPSFPVGCRGLVRRCKAHAKRGVPVGAKIGGVSVRTKTAQNAVVTAVKRMADAGIAVTPTSVVQYLDANLLPDAQARSALLLSRPRTAAKLTGRRLQELYKLGRVNRTDPGRNAVWTLTDAPGP